MRSIVSLRQSIPSGSICALTACWLIPRCVAISCWVGMVLCSLTTPLAGWRVLKFGGLRARSVGWPEGPRRICGKATTGLVVGRVGGQSVQPLLQPRMLVRQDGREALLDQGD